MGLVYRSATVIARQAHKHLGHVGRFDDCRRCHAFKWLPDRDLGIVVYHRGRLIETSAVAQSRLRP